MEAICLYTACKEAHRTMSVCFLALGYELNYRYEQSTNLWGHVSPHCACFWVLASRCLLDIHYLFTHHFGVMSCSWIMTHSCIVTHSWWWRRLTPLCHEPAYPGLELSFV